MVAIVIGGIELLQVAREQLPQAARFTELVASVYLSNVGYLVTAVIVTVWVCAVGRVRWAACGLRSRRRGAWIVVSPACLPGCVGLLLSTHGSAGARPVQRPVGDLALVVEMGAAG